MIFRQEPTAAIKKKMLLRGPRKQQIIAVTVSGLLREFTVQRMGPKLLPEGDPVNI